MGDAEPDGTAASMRRATPLASWRARVAEWKAWSVAHAPGSEAGGGGSGFYFFRHLPPTASPEEVLEAESTPPGCYPPTATAAFNVLLPGGECTARAVLSLSPASLQLNRTTSRGQLPESLRDTVDMSCLVGWRQPEGGGGRVVELYLKLQRGPGREELTVLSFHTGDATRATEALQAMASLHHAAHATPAEACAMGLCIPPEEGLPRYPLRCSALV